MTLRARVPLRLRVAAAFALTTALALVALGVFLHVRVASSLDEQTRASLEARSAALERVPPAGREAAVRELTGESFGQVLDLDGGVLASSPQLRDPLLPDDGLPAGDEVSSVESAVYLETEGERAPSRLRAIRTGDTVLVVGTSTEESEEVLEGLRAQLVLGSLLALLVASGLGYVVAGAALRPMERMRARAATISAGSAGERLPLPEVRDEVHRLGATLNEMLDRLDAGLRRERRFVAEASHELRTPLALLRTELDLAGSRPRTPEEQAAFLVSATEEVERLSRLVDQLLLLARADEGELELDRRPVVVVDLLQRVARRFEPAAEGRDVRVERGAADAGDPVTVLADPGRLDQAVSNLVDNALRHGAGTVTLSVEDAGDLVRVAVADEGGEGIDPQSFDRFRRGEGARAGGRGLGLSLVAAIVREHGGSVRLSDPPPTRVVLELPAQPVA